MRRTTTDRVLAGVVAALALSAAAAAQSIEPLAQNRQVGTLVNAEQCEGGFIGETIEAKDFAPFEESIRTEQSCEHGGGFASASQFSSIGSSAIVARGDTESAARGPERGVVHAIAASTVDVRFRVHAERDFSLTGQLSASGRNPGAHFGALVTLWRGDDIVFQRGIESDERGERQSTGICEVGRLGPGDYRIRVSGQSIIDTTVPPDAAGSASYQIELVVGTVARIRGFEVAHGVFEGGEVADLLAPDNEYVTALSAPFFEVIEPNKMDLLVHGNVAGETPRILHLSVEHRIDEPSGVARVFLFNYETESFEEVGRTPLGMTEHCVTIPNIEAGPYVNHDGDFVVCLRHVVVMQFHRLRFRSFVDLTRITVD